MFDWDGTLLDSYHADSAAYLEMFREMGIDWGLKQLAAHYSPNWHNVYRAAGLPRRRWREADRAWRQSYAAHRPALLPGARRVLGALKPRYRLGLVTSGDRDRVSRQLRDLRLTRAFLARVFAGDAPQRKPHPGSLLLALRRMRLAAETCVYVGDAPHDLLMARRARVRSIAIPGAFCSERKLREARPDLLLEGITELPGALEEFTRIV
ncbi:MAG TPA: HAD family hydrolase [Methylomirabilota bacterium]|nr:HAD family hydrolase [Methylomirabilota bacterium]